MFFERFPSSVGVFSGTYDDADWFERAPGRALHFFLSTAPLGTVLPAGHEVYDAHYWQSEGIPAVPQVFETHELVTLELKAESRRRLGTSNS